VIFDFRILIFDLRLFPFSAELRNHSAVNAGSAGVPALPAYPKVVFS
jgi:hypothetical protein